AYAGWYFFFFFSSRRRHTRWPRDWSSDVCSSDLVAPAGSGGDPAGARLLDVRVLLPVHPGRTREARRVAARGGPGARRRPVGDRSEERRVGKGRRSNLLSEQLV